MLSLVLPDSNCRTKHMLYTVVFSDPDRSYTSRQLTQLFPFMIKNSKPRVVRTSITSVSNANLKSAADKRSMFNKPARTVVWLFKCDKCAAMKPFFKRQTDKVMKHGLSYTCVKLCKELPKPWKRNRLHEVSQTARYAYTQHKFYEQRTL